MTNNFLKFKTLMGLIFFLTLTNAAQASGVFVEPALTYEQGDNSANYPSPLANSDGSVNGFGVGARAGFHLSDIFFAGLDGRFSMPKFKNSANSYEADATSFNWGPVVGVQMPVVGLRVWGTLILGGKLNPKASGNFDVKFTDASGYRIGAGFKVLLVSLNLEYQHMNYEETTFEHYGPFSSGSPAYGVNLENNSFIASVSFPLAL